MAEADETETLVKHPYYSGSQAVPKPLFGEATTWDRVLNMIVGVVTAILVAITLISAFAFNKSSHKGINIFFGVCILLILVAHLLLIYWYRQGDLEPKFRSLIYYNAFTLISLSICANLYIHNVA